MIAKDPPEPSAQRIFLFNGQGSTTIFSSGSAAASLDAAKASSAAATLLSRCHAAFLDDLCTIDHQASRTIAIDTRAFHDPRSLLSPPADYRTHGIIQGTTLLLHQLLHYLAYVETSKTTFDTVFDEILETTGLCSGILPALVVASSQSVQEFVKHGVEAFRLAFWVGYHSTLESHDESRGGFEGKPWMLTVSGIKQSNLQKKLETFCAASGQQTLHISAIIETELFSISGPPKDLQAFKEQFCPKLSTRPVDVYCWYHGGSRLEALVERVLEDLERRNVRFPAFSDLKKAVRSTLDGSVLSSRTSDGTTLREWVTREILVNCADWSNTVDQIARTVTGLSQRHPRPAIRLTSLGPASKMILAWTKSISSLDGVSIEDASSFRHAQFPEGHSGAWQDIAIVGMGVNLPHGDGPEALWNTISQGLDGISEIPESRFKLSDYYSSDQGSKGRTMSARFGAFLDNVWGFDNSFFNISPREARSMDPQQRILLQTSQIALENAGYVANSTPSSQTTSMGCYVGLATGDYTENLRDSIDVYYSPGTLRAFHSGRISYVNKFSGPSIVSDTACSSSLTALYQACRAIQNDDCTAAIAGGVNVICSPDMYIGLSKGHFLSSTGGCKTFDESADGYCRAEGCVMFVLKRLTDAVKEHDRILGTIKGIEINHSGNSHSITHPHSNTQTKLLRNLLAKSDIDPASISVVEAHGTGTQAGDICESQTLTELFGNPRQTNDAVLVSSIKGNIGHCEAASGAAGLAKLLLMLRKEAIPMQAGLTTLNPRLHGFGDGTLVVPRETTAWKKRSNAPRRALLNNFGAAGSNAALALEEPPTSTESRNPELLRSAYLFNLSAKSAEALRRSVTLHQQFIDAHRSTLRLEDICYTTTARREIYSHRLSLSCTSMQDLIDQLNNVRISKSDSQPGDRGMTFIFSGQGAVHRGMGSELIKTSPFFRTVVQQCSAILMEFEIQSLVDFLDNDGTRSHPGSKDDEIIATQCFCVVLQYALARLVMSWGILPQYLVGHSLGEYAALAISGALSINSALYVVALRAKSMVKECALATSGMLACEVSPIKAEEMIATNVEFSHLTVACRNSNKDCVLAGPLDKLESFKESCKHRKIKVKLLDVPYGFHSQAMDPIVKTLAEIGKSVRWSKPSIPVLSAVTGNWLDEEDCDGSYFARHARQPVLFVDCVDALMRQGLSAEAVVIEIGPHPITLPMVCSRPEASADNALATLRKGQQAWASLVSLLSKLHKLIDNINWRAVFADTDARMIDLPGYPLQYTDFKVPYHEAPTSHFDGPTVPVGVEDTGFRLLPQVSTAQSSDDRKSLETDLERIGPLILGHKVGGTALCPASVFHELALEAGRIFLELHEDQIFAVENLTFPNALVYDPSEGSRRLRVTITEDSGPLLAANFEITSGDALDTRETIYSTGSLVLKDRLGLETRWKRHSAMIQRRTGDLTESSSKDVSTFQKNILYSNIFARVVQYSEGYQSLSHLNVSTSLEGIGRFRMPQDSKDSGYIVPPVFTDTLLHAAGFIANVHVPIDTVCICAGVQSMEILYNQFGYDRPFTVFCTMYETDQNSIVADAYGLDHEGHTVAVLYGMEFKKLKLASFQRHLQGGPPKATTSPGVATKTVQKSKPSLSLREDDQSLSAELPTVKIEANGPDQDVESSFRAVVADVCGISDDVVDVEASLESLGIDSLLHIEILSKLSKAFPTADLDQDRLNSCDTLLAMEMEINSALGVSTDKSPSPADDGSSPGGVELSSPASSVSLSSVSAQPVAIQSSQSKAPPLYFFHDGSGQTSMYRRVGALERMVHAFASPRLSTPDLQHASLPEMASEYVASLRKTAGHDPVILAGWSFGGVIAFEAARQLLQAGISVAGLILIDAPLPIDHTPLPEELLMHLFGGGQAGVNISANSNKDTVLDHFHYHTRVLAEYRASPLEEGLRRGLRTVLLRSNDTLDTEKLCGVPYEWLNSAETQGEVVQGWKTLVGEPLAVLTIPGNHFEAFDSANIPQLTSQLREACLMLQKA